MRWFNKESKVKRSEFTAWPSMKHFDVSYWIPEYKMTEEEKKENPTYETTGGFTKKVEYKEAWKIFWRRTTEENKQKFLYLPNFDPEIFKEITGVDVESKEKTIEIEGKNFTVSELKDLIDNSLPITE